MEIKWTPINGFQDLRNVRLEGVDQLWATFRYVDVHSHEYKYTVGRYFWEHATQEEPGGWALVHSVPSGASLIAYAPYEEPEPYKDQPIAVGDEFRCITYSDTYGIVTSLLPDSVILLLGDGSADTFNNRIIANNWTPTGRTFPEINTILKRIRREGTSKCSQLAQ